MPSRERLAFSTNAFKKTSLAQALEVIAQAGYAACEIMADLPHMTPTTLTDDQLSGINSAVRSRGLGVSNINAFTGFFAAGTGPTGDTYHPTWLEHEEGARSVRIDHTVAAIRLARVLGAGSVSLQPGGPTIGTGLSRAEAGQRFADGVRRVLPAAREHGVVLAVEPEPGLYIQTTAEYRQWKAEFFADEPLVRMNFDVGHAFCVGEDPAAVAREMAGEYSHVHLEDIGGNRVHQHLTPGKGVIDFQAVFRALDDIRYEGWTTVELYPYETTAAGVAKLAYEHLRPMIGD